MPEWISATSVLGAEISSVFLFISLTLIDSGVNVIKVHKKWSFGLVIFSGLKLGIDWWNRLGVCTWGVGGIKAVASFEISKS